jgi:hypothetical protein
VAVPPTGCPSSPDRPAPLEWGEWGEWAEWLKRLKRLERLISGFLFMVV